jgi:hypothetical protein
MEMSLTKVTYSMILDGAVNPSEFASTAAAIAAAIENESYLINNTDAVLITVGASGDFTTLNEALEQATRMRPLYKTNNPAVEVKMLAGFVMQEQVIADGIDLSFVRLTSEDAEVIINRESLTELVYFDYYPAFCATNNGILPLIDALFNMNTTGSRLARNGFFC